ncbi:LapA family protein [SAR92 clade bacterium H455]|uniref:LapA family protein n=1 Tax=SAR92 clade bacterium H455 TaxID=2974818 RepID=A0ABY5TQB8_9GAMM|nr:putative integral membrane protein [Gammaproteobacteria bacterium MOLA455]UVW36022.1 LapA family protein [SAR92 clade bacterium H455]
MGAVWTLIKFLLLLAIAAVGAFFALENSQQVTVDFILFQSTAMNLGLWLMIFLVAGCLLGLLASSVLITYYRRKLARAAKRD